LSGTVPSGGGGLPIAMQAANELLSSSDNCFSAASILLHNSQPASHCKVCHGCHSCNRWLQW